MIQSERKKYILDVLNQENKVKAADVAKRFGVSMETVRRDLEELESGGCLRRVYGGAVTGTVYDVEEPYDSRQVIRLAEKQAIARRTVELLENGETVFMDGGTTLLEVARQIRSSKKNLTVITNAVEVAGEVVKSESCTVVLLGGLLTKGERITTGFLCNDNLSVFHAHKIIIGAAGISRSHGISDYSMEVAFTKRKMVQNADTVICASDADKFGKSVLNSVVPLGQVDILVTDWNAGEEQIRDCILAGMEVIRAKRPEEGAGSFPSLP